MCVWMWRRDIFEMRRHRRRRVVLASALLLAVGGVLMPPGVRGCSTLLVGKDASDDGSVLVTHSDDGEGKNDPRVLLVPPRDAVAQRPVFPDTENYPRYVGPWRGPGYAAQPGQNITQPIGYVEDTSAPRTLQYFDGNYAILNEKQVMTGGESTCSGVFATTAVGNGGKALFSINELSRIALERSTTAREAVMIMGEHAEKFGFYGASNGFEGGSESLMVADTEEGFVFHVLPDDTGSSAVWVAQRVPDDEVTVVMNMFTIRDVNLTDTHTFLGSPYMYEVAQRNGLWNESDGPLDFTKTFSNGEYRHKYYSGRRMWGAFRFFAPSRADSFPDTYDDLRAAAAYPWSVKPDDKVSVERAIEMHRIYYAGTKYDLSQQLAAGPFGMPERYAPGEGEQQVNRDTGKGAWERPIALFRSTYTTVIQARGWLPDTIGGVLWLGPSASLGTVFMPFAIGVSSLPESITRGQLLALDKDSAYWTFRYVHNIARLRYNDMSRTVIVPSRERLEARGRSLQQKLDEDAVAMDPQTAAMTLSSVYANHTADVINTWWSLVDTLIFKYADGFDNENGGVALGYPASWLEQIGFEDGPEIVPPKPSPPPSS